MLRHTPRRLNGSVFNNGLLITSLLRQVGGNAFAAKSKDAGMAERCYVSRPLPPPSLQPPPSAVSVSPGLPWGVQLPAEIARLGGQHHAVSRSPSKPSGAGGLIPQPPIHGLPFTTFPLYKDWLIPIFFSCCLCNEKLSTRSLIKFYVHPTPIPKIPAKKKREGRLKPGTHLAKGTLVNKKFTHHELQVTPPVILNPLPGDLAQAESDFMNCEAAMLKVCKLDINWTQKTGGAEWFSF